MSTSCFAPWCGIDGKYANPGVCNAPGGHRYKPPSPPLTVMEAHLAADCPDRATCWARDIHDAHAGTADERWANEGVSRHDALEVWQRRAGEWTDSRFPDDALPARGLVLGEETGEVLRCIVKATQGIRGGEDRWLAELPGEVADVFFCLAAIAHRAGFDLGRAVEDRWDALRRRTRQGEVEATR